MSEGRGTVEARLERARALLQHGKHKRALVEAWRAVEVAVRRGDEGGLEAVRDVAGKVRDEASGRTKREAETLIAYSGHSLDAHRAGERPTTLFDRLFSRNRTAAVKSCPDCAESIKAAARVCRYCGYRFEDS